MKKGARRQKVARAVYELLNMDNEDVHGSHIPYDGASAKDKEKADWIGKNLIDLYDGLTGDS